LMFYLLIISGFVFVLAVIVAHFSGVLKNIYTTHYHQSSDNRYKEKDKPKFKCVVNPTSASSQIIDGIKVNDIKQGTKKGNDCAKNLSEHTHNITRGTETMSTKSKQNRNY